MTDEPRFSEKPAVLTWDAPDIEDEARETVDVAYHTREIERHAALLRGEDRDNRVRPSDFRIPTGTALRRMRETCGLSVAAVSEQIGKSEQHLYQVERDDSLPSARMLLALLSVYRHEWPNKEVAGDE